MTQAMTKVPNPRRVAAGRINGSRRRPWSDEDRERLREQCLMRRPWEHSTGPRTAAGKAASAANGRHHRPTAGSQRQARLSVQDVDWMLKIGAELRREFGL